MENNTTEKITFYVGLKTKDGFDINGADALKDVSGVMADVTDGFNVIEGVGYWKGQAEYCLIVSFLNLSGASDSLITKASDDIRVKLNQDAVLVERYPVSFRMVG